MVLCGIAITGFTLTVFCDVTSRAVGRPWLWLQEVTTHFFVYGIFLGTAAATRRNDHLYLSAIVESFQGATRVFFEPARPTADLAPLCAEPRAARARRRRPERGRDLARPAAFILRCGRGRRAGYGLGTPDRRAALDSGHPADGRSRPDRRVCPGLRVVQASDALACS